MEKNRKGKIIIIIALILSIAGMSIGFAVFSNVLAISSSATVTPNEEDFKIAVYGLIDETEAISVFTNGNSPDLTKWSKTTAYQQKQNSFFSSKYNAVIDNNSNKLRISNIVGDFTEPGETAAYYFVIKNEGAYDAYLNMSDEMLSENSFVKSCTPGEGATPELVQNACFSLMPLGHFINSSGEEIEMDLNANYKITMSDYVILIYGAIYAGDTRADGPFIVEFIDYIFEFSSAPKE